MNMYCAHSLMAVLLIMVFPPIFIIYVVLSRLKVVFILIVVLLIILVCFIVFNFFKLLPAKEICLWRLQEQQQQRVHRPLQKESSVKVLQRATQENPQERLSRHLFLRCRFHLLKDFKAVQFLLHVNFLLYLLLHQSLAARILF